MIYTQINDVINKIIQGDAFEILKTFPNESINCVVTSPPYWGLRDYGVDGQLGLEKTPEEYIAKMVKLFAEIKRVLKPSGTVWLNLGDSYASNTKGTGRLSKKQLSNVGGFYKPIKLNHGLKPKDLVGIPWRVAFALQADGWYLRQDIIWHKPNPMPESVSDRCTKSHEYIFLLAKSPKYYFNAESIAEKAAYDGRKDTYFKGGVKYDGFNQQTMLGRRHERWKKDKNGEYIRNKRSVWTIPTKPFPDAHFAVYPEELIAPCIKAGCPENGIVFDPFMGAGTTAVVARKLGRKYIGIELNPKYIKIANRRLSQLRLF